MKRVYIGKKAMDQFEEMIERAKGIEKWAVDIPCYKNVNLVGFIPFDVLSLRHIQGILGYARQETTASYAHLTEITDQDCMMAVNNLVNIIHVYFWKV